MPERADPVVVVTGAAGGIGTALGRRFGTAGARVALLDVDREALQRVASELARAPSTTLAVPCDVTSLEATRRAVTDVVERWGGVDILINNAGITHVGAVRDTDVAVFRRVMDVNFFGAVHATTAALPSLVERRGRIVAVSSVAGFAPVVGRAGYVASKHALHGWFDTLRAELRGTGVSVTVVCPWFVRTEIGAHALGGDGRITHEERTRTGTPVEPEDLADAIHRAAMRRRPLLCYPRDARVALVVTRLAPQLFDRIMTRRLGRNDAQVDHAR